MKLAAALVALAALAGAQTTSSSGTTSSHSGWSFDDTVQTATDVFVGDILSGSGTDDGARVTVRANVRVVRVLSGGLAPGSEVALTWQYQPRLFDGPAATSKVPLERGLWFLRRDSGARLVPLQAGFDSYYLPAGASPRYYPASATLAAKIAAEIAPVIEDIVTQHAADLTPRPISPTPPLAVPAWALTRGRLQSLLIALTNLASAAKREIYADFSTRPDPYLKAIGIAGRLDAQDASALIDLEANLLTVTPIFDSGVVMLHAGGADVRNNLPAARALARLAVGERSLAGIEAAAAMGLASTRSPEFLPYFIVMLGAPTPWMRDSVLMAFCPLLRDTPHWKAEMQQHCPDRAPLNDVAAEQTEIRYWKAWWESNREQIAKTTPLPTVVAPARYNVQLPPPVEIPPEIRFMSLLGMARASASHSHGGDGAIVAEPPPGPHDPVVNQFAAADRAAYLDVVAATNAKLDANDKRSEQMMNAARLAGKMPEPAQMKALWEERAGILKAGLNDLRSRLSPAGWQIVQKFFEGMGITGATLSAPRP